MSAAQLGLAPDFAPPALMGAFGAVEKVVERTPRVRRLCADNMVIVRRAAALR